MKRLPLLLALAVLPATLGLAAPTPRTPPAKKPAPNSVEARVDALWKLSDAAFHKGDYPKAVYYHRQIVKLAPDDTESYGDGAWLLWSLGKRAEANAFIAQGLKANPMLPDMWETAGDHYFLERAWPDAKNAYRKAIQLNGPKAPEMLRRRLAHSAENAGDLPLARATWQALVRDFPNGVNKNNLARLNHVRSGPSATV